jgi:hypothetical protein
MMTIDVSSHAKEVPFESRDIRSVTKKILRLYDIRILPTLYKRAHIWSLSWLSGIQSKSS